jgi:hypothetical protein
MSGWVGSIPMHSRQLDAVGFAVASP